MLCLNVWRDKKLPKKRLRFQNWFVIRHLEKSGRRSKKTTKPTSANSWLSHFSFLSFPSYSLIRLFIFFKWAITGLNHNFHVFYTANSMKISVLNIAHGWIQTHVNWCWRRRFCPLYRNPASFSSIFNYSTQLTQCVPRPLQICFINPCFGIVSSLPIIIYGQ